MNSDGAYGAFAGQTMHIDGLYYNKTFAQHLNMAYDRPIWITLKIKSPKQEDNPTRRIRADYTFLHDWFGDQFKFVRIEETATYDDLVKVECSPFAMVHWALQYSDRVEVVAPEEVRNGVIEKIRNLNVKYGL